LSTSFKGERTPPEVASERSTWSQRTQRTQNPSLPPENSTYRNLKTKVANSMSKSHTQKLNRSINLTVTGHVMITITQSLDKWHCVCKALQDGIDKACVA
jgi:hypothetical protein